MEDRRSPFNQKTTDANVGECNAGSPNNNVDCEEGAGTADHDTSNVPGFASALDWDPPPSQPEDDSISPPQRAEPLRRRRRRAVISTYIVVGLFLVVTVTLYFTLPWVPVVEDVLEWIDDQNAAGDALLFGLHVLAMLTIIGPTTTLEYGWFFIRGWRALPIVILSYIVSISIMLTVGRHSTTSPCCKKRLPLNNNVLQATQQVLDRHPYRWYVAFQYWAVVPWRATVYGAHVLAPHAHALGVGMAVLLGQLPELVYRAWVGATLTSLDSLVTGRLDTTRDTIIFWVSVVVTTLVSAVLYVCVRQIFLRHRAAATAGNAGEGTAEMRSSEVSAPP